MSNAEKRRKVMDWCEQSLLAIARDFRGVNPDRYTAASIRKAVGALSNIYQELIGELPSKMDLVSMVDAVHRRYYISYHAEIKKLVCRDFPEDDEEYDEDEELRNFYARKFGVKKEVIDDPFIVEAVQISNLTENYQYNRKLFSMILKYINTYCEKAVGDE